MPPTATSLDTVWVHADESCLGNQFERRANPGGAAGLVEIARNGAWERRDYWVSEPDTTNNRMAIRSAIEALRCLRRRCTVHFVSDSQYLVKGIDEWLPRWRLRGMRRKGGALANLELWQELAAEIDRHDVRPHWVRGHADHLRNEYANHLATRAARDGTASDGLVPSGLEAWWKAERAKGRFAGSDEIPPPRR
jgi:ribonuclease HI